MMVPIARLALNPKNLQTAAKATGKVAARSKGPAVKAASNAAVRSSTSTTGRQVAIAATKNHHAIPRPAINKIPVKTPIKASSPLTHSTKPPSSITPQKIMRQLNSVGATDLMLDIGASAASVKFADKSVLISSMADMVKIANHMQQSNMGNGYDALSDLNASRPDMIANRYKADALVDSAFIVKDLLHVANSKSAQKSQSFPAEISQHRESRLEPEDHESYEREGHERDTHGYAEGFQTVMHSDNPPMSHEEFDRGLDGIISACQHQR